MPLRGRQLVDFALVSTNDPTNLGMQKGSTNNVECRQGISQKEEGSVENEQNYKNTDKEIDSNLENRLHTEERDEEEKENAIENKQELDKVKPRKRIRNEDNWKVTKRSRATLAGKKHVSKSGKKINAKKIKPGCAPCKRNCTYKINEFERVQVFNNYWNENKTWDLKRQFVLSRVKSTPIKRKRSANGTRDDQRKRTIHYNFEVDGKIIEVCKLFFCNTLGISETVVKNALIKSETGGFISPDMRGKHVPKNKVPEDVKERARTHIRSFPTYESHYSRNKTKRQYLGSELNIDKMYNLYKIKCAEEGVEKSEIVKSWLYRRLFKTDFNLGFKMPSNDTCDTCDSLKMTLLESKSEEERAVVQEKIDCHLKDADVRYNSKKNDKVNLSEKTKVIMLDLQKCLPTPYLSNAKSFYFLKLWTLNLTIYDATEKKAYCMVWDESTAGKGGNEISSALLKWAKEVLKNSSIETLIIWSDNCPCQNRNIMMAVNYFFLLNLCPTLKTIIHKFLLKGHTHMEADHVHGLIERTIKKQPALAIVTPWDWQQLIRSVGSIVWNMELNDFKNFNVLYSSSNAPFLNRKKNTEKQNFLISFAVWLEAHRDSPGMLYYKTEFTNKELKSVNLSRNCRKTVASMPHELPVMRETPKGITAKKHQHLLKLCEWIPSQFHCFYRDMTIAKQEEENPDSE